MSESELRDVSAIVDSYVPEFRSRMWISGEDLTDPVVLRETVLRLEPDARDLAEALMIGVGGGQPLPERFYERVDESGENLWLSGVLLPRIKPSKGTLIDPRYYTASSWVNPGLRRVEPLAEVHGTAEGEGSAAPSSTRWDARIVAVYLENEPMRVTLSGDLRKDETERMVHRLGGDDTRWRLAMSMARKTGLARVVNNRLHGFPATSVRYGRDPTEILDGVTAETADALLRIVRNEWVDLDLLAEVLCRRCPDVLSGVDQATARRRLGLASDALQRLGRLDAIRNADGIEAVRVMRESVEVPRGILVTSDGEILAVPDSLTCQEYGRLARMAPFTGGDVIYRHRLGREGIAADLAAGYTDADAWLRERSPNGFPSNILQLVRGWSQSVRRISLWTGVSVVEEDGVLRRVESSEAGHPRFDYSGSCTGELHLEADHVWIDRNLAPLGLVAAMDRAFGRMEPTGNRWVWRLSAQRLSDPEKYIADVEKWCESRIPGRVEAAIRAAGGGSLLRQESAILLHFEPAVLDSLCRDSALSGILTRIVKPGQVVVARSDLDTVLESVNQLGIQENRVCDGD